jgi:hypothetical protein
MVDQSVKRCLIAKKETTDNYIISKGILKEHFKFLYGQIGKEWTEQDDKQMDFVIDSIEKKAVFDSGDIIIKSR